ncbi:MAG: flagellar protein FlaG [Pseudomonadota bacterium]
MSNDIARSLASALPNQNDPRRSREAAGGNQRPEQAASARRSGAGNDAARTERTDTVRNERAGTERAEDAQTTAEARREQLEEAAREMQARTGEMGRDLRFEVGEDGDTTVIKVMDPTTDEVVRQIPSEEAVARAAAARSSEFNLIDETA